MIVEERSCEAKIRLLAHGIMRGSRGDAEWGLLANR